MRISDWSSDVCSSDLRQIGTYCEENRLHPFIYRQTFGVCPCSRSKPWRSWPYPGKQRRADPVQFRRNFRARSEEHTSELQSLMRTSYADFCLKKQSTRKIGDTLHIKHSLHSNYIEKIQN